MAEFLKHRLLNNSKNSVWKVLYECKCFGRPKKDKIWAYYRILRVFCLILIERALNKF